MSRLLPDRRGTHFTFASCLIFVAEDVQQGTLVNDYGKCGNSRDILALFSERA